MDSLGEGNILRKMDSLGEGNLSRQVDSLGEKIFSRGRFQISEASKTMLKL